MAMYIMTGLSVNNAWCIKPQLGETLTALIQRRPVLNASSVAVVSMQFSNIVKLALIVVHVGMVTASPTARAQTPQPDGFLDPCDPDLGLACADSMMCCTVLGGVVLDAGVSRMLLVDPRRS